MTRSYRQTRRAREQANTRLKIVEATVALHQAQGVAATSAGDIAARAGVGKATVYRHFPDEAGLLQACSAHYFTAHPLPDPETWRRVADPRARLRRALGEVYAYHRATEAMMARVLPEIGDQPVAAPYHAHWRRAAGILAEAWREAACDTPDLRAALALALDFRTWQVLVRDQGLDDAAAAELMLRLAPG